MCREDVGTDSFNDFDPIQNIGKIILVKLKEISLTPNSSKVR